MRLGFRTRRFPSRGLASGAPRFSIGPCPILYTISPVGLFCQTFFDQTDQFLGSAQRYAIATSQIFRSPNGSRDGYRLPHVAKLILRLQSKCHKAWRTILLNHETVSAARKKVKSRTLKIAGMRHPARRKTNVLPRNLEMETPLVAMVCGDLALTHALRAIRILSDELVVIERNLR